MLRHILETVLEEVVLGRVLDTRQTDLDELSCGLPALSVEMCEDSSLIDFCAAVDGEGPEDLLADHDDDLACVHFAGSGHKGERHLENAI